MSSPAVDAEQAQVPEPCASCGAPLAHDQRYCLHCGELRAGARRRVPAALHGAVRAAGEPAAAPVADMRALPGPAVLLAGLACLLLAMGIGVLIGRGGADPAAQAPITVAAAPAAAPVAASFTGDWPAGTDGWTIALAQLPKATATPAAVAQAKRAAQGRGAPAIGALDSDAYPSLTAGSYVVYSGAFDSQKAAKAARAALTAAFPDARVVRVGNAAPAPAAGAAGTGAAKAESTAKRTPAKQGSGGSDTKSEFEKSKKAPKTVGTGGTPPPKDSKPAAGGSGFQDIG